MTDNNLIDDLMESARAQHEQEKAGMKRATEWNQRYENDEMGPELQEIKARTIELVRGVQDNELLEWGDLRIRLYKELGLNQSGISKADLVMLRVIDDERVRRGLPDPDDYVDPDVERWDEIVGELPYNATADEIAEAIAKDIEDGPTT